MLLKNIQSAEADLNLSRLLAEETETGNEFQVLIGSGKERLGEGKYITL